MASHILERRGLNEAQTEVEILWRLEGADGVEHDVWWPATFELPAVGAISLADLEAGKDVVGIEGEGERPAKRRRGEGADEADHAITTAPETPRFPLFRVIYRGGVVPEYPSRSPANVVLLTTRLLDDLTGGSQCPYRLPGETWDGSDPEEEARRDEDAFLRRKVAAAAAAAPSGGGGGGGGGASVGDAAPAVDDVVFTGANAANAAKALLDAVITSALQKYSARLASLPHSQQCGIAEKVEGMRALFVAKLESIAVARVAAGGVVTREEMDAVVADVARAVATSR